MTASGGWQALNPLNREGVPHPFAILVKGALFLFRPCP